MQSPGRVSSRLTFLNAAPYVRVHDGENVEIVLVKDSLDSSVIFLVSIDELIREVLNNLSCIG